MRLSNLIGFILASCLSVPFAETTQAASKERQDKMFIFDRYWSLYSAASIVASSRYLSNDVEDAIPRIHIAQHRRVGGAISFVLNYVLNRFLLLVNHEVYGHGFRLRSFAVPCSYNLGVSGGVTRFRPNHYLSLDKMLMIIIGGCEATSILAQQLLFSSFKKMSMDRRTYSLFLWTNTDLLAYILNTYSSKEERESRGNDVSTYLREINSKHRSKIS